MYSLVRALLFRLDAEKSHHFTLNSLKKINQLGLVSGCLSKIPEQPVEVMGIRFPNPVGLAAGLDKNGDYIDALGNLGFGFIEIGTITPKPQPGNPLPRLFRLPKAQAIINRMGFNNKGVDHLVEQVKAKKFKGVLGINIGKNAATAAENAVDDYVICMQKVYALADYITVNISSPNTKGLRDLQFGDALDQLLARLKQEQAELQKKYQRYVPLAVKIAPDMDSIAIQQVAASFLKYEIDAVIATNTTLSRDGVENLEHGNEAGGLSGAPVRDKSTQVIREFYAVLGEKIPIIGVGGILTGEDAAEKIRAGAKLVQIYSGFIYRGPALIREAVETIRAKQKK